MNGDQFFILIHAVILSLAPGLPLVLALACCVPITRRKAMRFLPWAALPALITGIIIPVDVVVEVPWFFMGGRMGLDDTGRIFLWLCAFVWLLAGIRGYSQLTDEAGGSRFAAYFLTAMAGNFGLVLAQDMLGFYLFFALMSLAGYGLIVHYDTDDCRRAGRIYLILVIIGEVAMFTALLLLAHDAGSTAINDLGTTRMHTLTLVLLFIGFGVKIGAFPFHVWMPLAYPSASVAGATAMAGAMINGGLLGWLRFLPLGQAEWSTGAVLFIVSGSFAALFGVVCGLGQKQARAVLAYSSISQMGMMTIIAGLGLVNTDAGKHGVAVLTLYAVHHALAKSSLFLGLSGEGKALRQTPGWQTAGMLLPALALAGLPLSSGAIAKTALKDLTIIAGAPWQGFFSILLPVAAMGTTVLMLHFIRLLRRPAPGRRVQTGREQMVWTVSLTAVAGVFWLWPKARPLAEFTLRLFSLWQGLWPVATGCLIALCLAKIVKDRDVFYRIEGGDILILFVGSARFLERLFRFGKNRQEDTQKSALPGRKQHPTSHFPWLRREEKMLGRWTGMGFCYLVLVSLLFFLLGR